MISDSFTRGAGGYHWWWARRGASCSWSSTRSITCKTPIENLPYTFYKEFITTADHKGKFAPYVQTAIPYCLGDNYEGFRVVGTVPELFEKLEYAGGKKYEFQAAAAATSSTIISSKP